MARLPKLLLDSDGNANIRITLPRPVYLLVKQFAEQMRIPLEVSVRMFMEQLSATLEEGLQISWLGPSFEKALRVVKDANHGVISSGPGIDLSKLHTSPKTKSGFVGVYANGKGFKATSRRVGTGGGPTDHYIGTFQTAEEAAWRRYLYYKTNKLPYGALEEEIYKWRRDGIAGTDEELIHMIIRTARDVNQYHLYAPFLPDDFVEGRPPVRGIPPEPTGLLKGLAKKVKAEAVKPELPVVADPNVPFGIDPSKVDEIFGVD